MSREMRRITVEQPPVFTILFSIYANLLGFSTNKLVTKLLSDFLLMPDRVRDKILTHYSTKIHQLEEEISSLNQYFRQSKMLILNQYRFMLFCICLSAPFREASLNHVREQKDFAATHFRSVRHASWKFPDSEEVVLPQSPRRASVELPLNLANLLEDIKKTTYLSFSRVTNYILFAFLLLPSDVKKEETAFFQHMFRQAEREAASSNEYTRESIVHEREAWEGMLSWLSLAGKIDGSEVQFEPPMRTISLKSGYIIFPTDWKVLNEDEAAHSKYAFAVEIGHVDNAPHFLYFTDRSRGKQDQAFFDGIYQFCVDAWEPFSSYWEAQIKMETDDNGFPTNLNDWERAPMIGAFPLYVSGNPRLPLDYTPPYGAQIVPDDLALYFDSNGNEI